MADVCTHDVTDREVAAVADGLCPLCLDGMVQRQSLEIERLRGVLEFVSTDPCFKFLGTVTQDKINAVLIQD